MSAIKNRVQLIGNLGQDPSFTELDGGKKVVSFSMATNETYKNAAGEKVTDTQWHNIVAWGKLAENISTYAKKGTEMVVTGKLTTRSYETKEGEKRYTTEVVINEFLLLGSKDSNPTEEQE